MAKTRGEVQTRWITILSDWETWEGCDGILALVPEAWTDDEGEEHVLSEMDEPRKEYGFDKVIQRTIALDLVPALVDALQDCLARLDRIAQDRRDDLDCDVRDPARELLHQIESSAHD